MWEWCLDGYDSGFYDQGGVDPVAPWKGTASRVTRGGCFFRAVLVARSAFRGDDPPSFAGRNVGVRPAVSVSTD